jgi:hypothetical protein
MNGFDFAGWLQVVLPTATLIAGINIAAVQGLGKWVSGTAQTIAAGVTGLLLGFGAGLAFFGIPSDFLGWFLNVVYGLLVFGVSVGTYEAVKHASGNGG